MFVRRLHLLTLLCLGGSVVWAVAQTNEPVIPRAIPVAQPVNPPGTNVPVAAPDPAVVAEEAAALGVVRSMYVDPAGLDALGPEVTLDQLLTTFRGAVALAGGPLPETLTNGPAVRSELVDGRHLYVRARQFGASNELAGVLLDVATNGVEAVVLDLRGCEDFLNYEAAVAWVSPFLPAGRVLFTLTGANDPGTAAVASGGGTNWWRSVPLAVLVNGATAGAAEAAAAALHDAGRAVLVGTPTRGLGVVFSETKLPDGRYLRVATRRVMRPDGNALYPTPAQPDILVKVEPADEARLLADQWENGVAAWVNDAAGTPQQSEAALVRGENPDVDALRERLEARRKKKAQAQERDDLPARDPALQRAFDLFRSLDALDLTPREVKLRRAARTTNTAPEVKRPRPPVPAGG